jgi:hypothetical protein
MNKGQPLALGGVLAAALLLRQAGSYAPQGAPPSDFGKNGSAAAAALDAREGPWIASCNYWAVTRRSDAYLPVRPPDVSGTLGTLALNLHIDLQETSRRPELGCGGKWIDRWGFPKNGGQPHVTAIIAAVPDPVHTHLALTFDRAVDAILQAAADNGYVSSYYWLPWKNREATLKVAETQWDVEPGHDSERERQPGLLILRHVPGNSEPTDSSTNYNTVIYLFLVAETPTKGVDGYQLQSAFSYEAELKGALIGSFSTGANGRLAIIGPLYSGSAASLRAGIEAAQANSVLNAAEVELTGATTPSRPVEQLTSSAPLKIRYLSFLYDGDFSTQTFLRHLSLSGYEPERVALLVEDNTAFGIGVIDDSKGDPTHPKPKPLVIRFPREISLLRNAQAMDDRAAPNSGLALSPYLHFSIKDSSAQDSVPIFSRENTPLSQEAQLMTIARQLHRYRTQFIAINASNVLDQIFLAQFLHRACPEATLVFFGSDLLTVREIDSVPFIGSIAITPYPMIGLGGSAKASMRPTRTYPNSSSYAYYNAAAYTFWHNGLGAATPTLQGYRNLLEPANLEQPPLWATVIGRDGYYPLAILSPCSSDQAEILPAIHSDGKTVKQEAQQTCKAQQVMTKAANVVIYPSRLWDILCILVLLLCLVHGAMIYAADYWSPFTRDLAIQDNDQPFRRSVFVHVSAAMLLSMAFAISFPMLCLSVMAAGNPGSIAASVATLLAGILAGAVTLSKTRDSIGPVARHALFSERRSIMRRLYDGAVAKVYLLLNCFILLALITILCVWGYACCTGSFAGFAPDISGLSFAFRCINPGSGVSPLPPVLLLLTGWYLWGLLQTRRLRFSTNARPQLPRKLYDAGSDRFFVSDDELERSESFRDSCLYENITCLLITRKVICRLYRFCRVTKPETTAEAKQWTVKRDAQLKSNQCLRIDIVLALTYSFAMAGLSVCAPICGADHFLWNTGAHFATPYEFLMAGLFFPLLSVSLAGWLRMILIWAALKRGLLDRLENLPLRFAFSRLKGTGWMTMLRQGGLQEHWRDMARSLESIRQMLHHPDLLASSDHLRLKAAHESLLQEIGEIRTRFVEPAYPAKSSELDYDLMRRVEVRLALFSNSLLSGILIPYWKNERTGLVESKETRFRGRRMPSDPVRVLVAEEFLAIRYISLIRAVLANLRYLMTFVSLSFVMAILAWNSYPFQPRQTLDWFFTFLLAFLGAGVIWVFAQMHRDPILSRITDTSENSLGLEFYVRVFSFGALPVVTWLAYQFPEIGGLIYRFIQPAEPVMR